MLIFLKWVIHIKWQNLYIKKGAYESKVFSVRSELNGKLINSIYESVGYDVDLFIRSSADTVSWTHYRKIDGYLGEESFSSSFYYQVGAVLTDRYNQGVFLKKVELFIEEAIVHNNNGDMEIPIKLNLFDKIGNQEIKIYNNSTNEELVVNNLNRSEILYIDSEAETIISSLEGDGVYRYDNHNDTFLHLKSGKNFITTKGEFELDIQYQEIYLQD